VTATGSAPDQAALSLRRAGARSSEATTLVAIALAESGANPRALRIVGSCRMRGAWQINGCAHPEVVDACAFDLDCSAAYSLRLYRAQGGKPWSTYTNGTYRKFMPQAQASVRAASWDPAIDCNWAQRLAGACHEPGGYEGPAGVGGAPLVVGAKAATGVIGDALSGVMAYITRGGALLFGGLLVLVALYFLAGGPNPIQLLGGGVSKVAGAVSS
jgi:lysozyme-like protein